jgi:hypothetical protein
VARFFGAQHGPRPPRSQEESGLVTRFCGCTAPLSRLSRLSRHAVSKDLGFLSFQCGKPERFLMVSGKASAALSQISDVDLLQLSAQQLRRLKLWWCVLALISRLQTELHVAPSLLR